jgi:hypothetical protein
MLEGRIHTSFCKEFSKHANENLANSKMIELKSNDCSGHGDEMFHHQIAAPFVGANAFARRNIAACSIDDPLIRQKVCKLAIAWGSRVSASMCLSPSDVSNISFEISKACLVDDHQCSILLRSIILEAVACCGISSAERKFVCTKLEQVRWL